MIGKRTGRRRIAGRGGKWCAGGEGRTRRRRAQSRSQRKLPVDLKVVRPVGVRSNVMKGHGTWERLQVVLNGWSEEWPVGSRGI